jgi:hypothetical protein
VRIRSCSIWAGSTRIAATNAASIQSTDFIPMPGDGRKGEGKIA